ncbi:MAG TPA: family 78 glycoside hydrolase catalytic domain [Acidobacteriaceae bacterium]
MRLLALLCFSLSLFASVAFASPVHLQAEHRTQPLDIDAAAPRFSWQSDAHTPDWMQQAYQIKISTDEQALRSSKAEVWDSGRIASSDSVNIAYTGPALHSETRYYWTVRVWDNKGASEVSAPTWFETGLLSPSDWKSQWIYRSDPAAAHTLSMVRWLWLPGSDAEHVKPHTTAEFRYVLHLGAQPLRASLHVLARGDFAATVNGEHTGQHTHWNAFDWEEITPHLRPGDNEIVVRVTSPEGEHPDQPQAAAIAATIRILDANGREQRIVSDRTWSARVGDNGPWVAAQEIGPLRSIHPDEPPPPDRITTEASLLRKDFSIQDSVRSARLIVTALGAYDTWLNGSRVAPETLLSPGFTDFRKRVLYRTYDVTALVVRGQNTLGFMLGGGWHGSPLTWSGTRYFTGPDILRAQLEITFQDGRRQVIATDSTWQTAAAPVLSSEIYGGEDYDARADQAGWNKPGFAARGWSHAVTGPAPPDLQITAAPDAPITTIITLHPASLSPSSATHHAVFDMGQNMVGNVRLHIRGPRGALVHLRYAERLNPDGSIYTENLRNATATDDYILSGKGDEIYVPNFTFHGFRYVEVSGYTGGLSARSIEGLVYNSLPEQPSMRLHTSSDLLNRMAGLGFWGQRGNFVSIPTDCPQRDERLGWMGDAGVFWRTGTYNFNIAAFTQKFMNDIVDAQEANGSFTDISPDLLQPEAGAPGWADAGILVPYAAWLQYGDTALLERAWPQMNRYMDFIERANPDHLRRNQLGANYADWLAPDPNTPRDLIATAYWAIVAQQMQQMATALHRTDDAEKYGALYDAIVDAYRAAYIDPDGSVAGNTQSAYVVTLYSGIAPSALRTAMTEHLVKDIEAHGNHLTTGFLGTPFLMFVLDENGRADVAYKLLLQDTYPSWGYMVRKGATTWWERWNGDTGDPSMNSYNHYAFGSVMAWVFRRVAGIDTEAAGPGFHHLVIAPHFDPALPQVHAEYNSDYGLVTTDWNQAQHRFTVTTPANTTASITLPGVKQEQVGSGAHTYTIP